MQTGTNHWSDGIAVHARTKSGRGRLVPVGVVRSRHGDETSPPRVQSMGTANASAPVWLWSIDRLNTLTSRKGEYFWGELDLGGEGALYAPLTNIAILNGGQYLGREVRTNWLPARPELFDYDLDGNLTVDGRWDYAWDAENRLIRMVANNAVAPQRRVEFEYDWQGRRIGKKVWNNTAGSGSPVVHLRFVYDGWNLLGEIDALNPQPRTFIRTYVWGTDLSGTFQGAGGVGGLLKVNQVAAPASSCFVAYDGNGNVDALFNAANGATAASYEYGPFGEVIRATGPMAKTNPFRFSTKYQDDETDLLYYGYRYYSASTGGWLSRDPSEENGGYNLYAFVLNSPTAAVDVLGLGTWRIFEDQLDLNMPGINVKAQDPNGFSVIYRSDPGECHDGEIKVFQIVSVTGLRGTSATVDAPTDSRGHRLRKMKCPLPPIMTPPVPGIPCSYQDSPGGVDATWRFTAVAVCRRKCKELSLLSTYYFEFDSATRKITKRDPSYQDHFRAGMKRWWALDEKWFIDFYYPNGVFW